MDAAQSPWDSHHAIFESFLSVPPSPSPSLRHRAGNLGNMTHSRDQQRYYGAPRCFFERGRVSGEEVSEPIRALLTNTTGLAFPCIITTAVTGWVKLKQTSPSLCSCLRPGTRSRNAADLLDFVIMNHVLNHSLHFSRFVGTG